VEFCGVINDNVSFAQPLDYSVDFPHWRTDSIGIGSQRHKPVIGSLRPKGSLNGCREPGVSKSRAGTLVADLWYEDSA
jgi:hypothetical protein